MRQKIIFAVIVLAVLFVIGQKANMDSSVTSPKTDPIAASALIEEYNSNEVRADAKYKGKTVAVRGLVLSIGKSMGNPYVVVASDENSLIGVYCQFDDDKEVSELNKGDKISVTGKCAGKLVDLLLYDCVFSR